MYALDWFEQRRRRGAGATGTPAYRISPIVWTLGLTSLLTDISSEMVSSLLPLYLVLHLHLSPLQFGAIDGVYNGFATLLIALAAGWYADRTNRRKETAAAGYGLSALCKLLLIVAGGAWGWILLVTGIDRIGKGMRSAPRDALISLHTSPEHLATAFGVHRAMDAAGAMLGPLAAFFLIAAFPEAFDLVWLVSFVFAALGIAAILLLVPRATDALPDSNRASVPLESQSSIPGLMSRRFAVLLACAALLAAATVSDSFIYLLLQKQFSVSAGYMPLFPVINAASYMLFAVPVSRLADRTGRTRILLAGYATLVLMYVLLATTSPHGTLLLLGCLATLGLYYAATEGILVALASRELPASSRTAGLALLATAVGVGKMISSLTFGWIWSGWSQRAAVAIFLAALTLSAALVCVVLRNWNER